MDVLNFVSKCYFSDYLFKYKPVVWYKLFILNKNNWSCFSETLLRNRYSLTIGEHNALHNFKSVHRMGTRENYFNEKIYPAFKNKYRIYLNKILLRRNIFDINMGYYNDYSLDFHQESFNIFDPNSLDKIKFENNVYGILIYAIKYGDINTIDNFMYLIKLNKNYINKNIRRYVLKPILNNIINSLISELYAKYILKNSNYQGDSYYHRFARMKYVYGNENTILNTLLKIIQLANYFKIKYSRKKLEVSKIRSLYLKDKIKSIIKI